MNDIFETRDGPVSPVEIGYMSETFTVPLTGSYNWDYQVVDNRIRKIYELGKILNWNSTIDLDWSSKFSEKKYYLDPSLNPFKDTVEFKKLSSEARLAMDHHTLAWTLSQFLHGEQGALMVASQLVNCAPTHQAKLCAASQAFDEARHVEVFNQYLKRVGVMYPIDSNLKKLLDSILTHPSWDIKFLGMQIIIEGLALAAFESLKNTAQDPLLKEILRLVKRDEARHVTFGVNYLQDYTPNLSPSQIKERENFAYEACVVMRERLVNSQVPSEFLHIPESEARDIVLCNVVMGEFREILFANIVPNLKRVGLLSASLEKRFSKLGIMKYVDFENADELSLASLETPLFKDKAS
jgi:hypothetical protein